MAGVIGPAAQRINADTAGLTQHPGEINPGAPVAAVPHEITSELLPTEKGGLEHIFNDGIPNPTMVVERAVVQPTRSILGRLGGLVPQSTSPQSPGPGGAPVQTHPGAVEMNPAAPGMIVGSSYQPGPGGLYPNAANANLGTYVARVRKWLGLGG